LKKIKELKDKAIDYIKENHENIQGAIAVTSIAVVGYCAGILFGKAKQLENDTRTMACYTVDAYTYGLKDGYQLKEK